MSECTGITKLTVLDRNGKPKAVLGRGSRITGRVRLESGVGIALARDNDTGELVWAAGANPGADDPVYRAKWLKIVNGEAPFAQGLPFYLSRVNNVRPHPDGTFFLAAGLCPQLGAFQNPEKPALNPSPTPHNLEFYDMCAACIDCGDYQLLFKYLERIKDWLDANKDNNLDAGLKLFKQYEAVAHYWNYLVHAQSLILRVAADSADGANLSIRHGYHCLGCGPYTSFYSVVTVAQVSGQAASGAWTVNSTDINPSTLRVTTTTAPTLSMDILSIDKDQFAVVDTTYTVARTGSSSESQSSETLNVWDVTATWYNTHLGVSATRTKRVSTTQL